MHTVGIRELKTRLGRYLALVREGATLIVTDRGRPVAELRPLSPALDDEDALLADLAALGAVSVAEPSPLSPLTPEVVPGPPLSTALLADRADRA